ncbi:MAG: hypothetical protein ABL898_10285 [Hyphomicrobiaceae bacterium]
MTTQVNTKKRGRPSGPGFLSHRNALDTLADIHVAKGSIQVRHELRSLLNTANEAEIENLARHWKNRRVELIAAAETRRDARMTTTVVNTERGHAVPPQRGARDINITLGKALAGLQMATKPSVWNRAASLALVGHNQSRLNQLIRQSQTQNEMMQLAVGRLFPSGLGELWERNQRIMTAAESLGILGFATKK